MIRSFRAKNYGCLKDVSIGLTPLHAFVGPNDSGKSTILRGIRTVVQFAGSRFERTEAWHPFDPQFRVQHPQGPSVESTETLLACGVAGGWYGVAASDGKFEERAGESNVATAVGESPSSGAARAWNHESKLLATEGALREIRRELVGARLLRLDPDALREPSAVIPEDQALDFFNERGFGFPSVYQAILGRGDEASDEIRAAIRVLFPTIKRIGVRTTRKNTFSLEGELTNGSKIQASAMSEGLLYYLAFLVIPHLDPVSVLLIEEPENGLHPARIQEVVRTIRAFVDKTGTQVLIATHSPLVINELRPEEVSVVTRPSLEEGTKVTPIKDTPNFEKRSSVYALGELWLAYADGKVEAPLFEEGRR
jgi:energy-coupling factor transporter ATP-binding protein EcfA2